MKRKIIVLWSLASIFLAGEIAQGINDKAGTSAYQFLKIGRGARAVGMGGAFTGLADDENGLYWNPAGLAQVKGKIAIFSYNNYPTDIQSGFLGYLSPYGEGDVLGISLLYMDYGEMDRMDEEGVKRGTFVASDMALSVSYARPFRDRLFLGINGKIVYEKIGDYGSSDGYAIDLGGLYRFASGKTRFGLMVQNLGFQRSGLTSEHKDPLPTTLRLGFSHRLKGLPLLVDLDLAKPLDNDPYFSLGAELYSLKPLILRFGYNHQKRRDDKSSGDNLAGCSWGMGMGWKRLKFDYAYVFSFACLGGNHRFSISKSL